MDTGAVYVLKEDAHAPVPSPKTPGITVAGGTPLGEGTSPTSHHQVRELLSGKHMSLSDFESLLGYAKDVKQSGQTEHQTPRSLSSTPRQGGEDMDAGALASMWAQKSRAAWGASASWVKLKSQKMMQRLNSSGGSSGNTLRGVGGSGGSSFSFSSNNNRNSRSVPDWLVGAATTLSSQQDAAGAGAGALEAEDGQGARVKVQTKSRQFKEFSDLRLVQTLSAHQGVVWTMKFSPSGRYLASAGQDGIVRVWEVNKKRGNTNNTKKKEEEKKKQEVVDEPSASPSSRGPKENDPVVSRSSGTAPPAPAPAAAREEEEEEEEVDTDVATVASTSPLGVDARLAVLMGKPIRSYRGHKQDVLDVAWSTSNFILSASMDKTVRLWHVSMDDCLRVFKHTDFVTSIDFNPVDDKLFISGSIDGKMRLWNVPEQRVVSWQDVHEMVTAVKYSPDGRKAVVGTMRGRCRFYGADKNSLEYEAQLDVKNTRGQHSRGKKITGLEFLAAPTASNNNTKSTRPGSMLLITSNDSRIRLYEGYALKCKYKGHTNRNTQIKASCSPGGEYIICGSDDGWVYMWSVRTGGGPPPALEDKGGLIDSSTTHSQHHAASQQQQQQREKNSSYECFHAGGDVMTVAVFGPITMHRPVETINPAGASWLGPGLDQEQCLKRGGHAAARGQVVLTAGYGGEIRAYENVGVPMWN